MVYFLFRLSCGAVGSPPAKRTFWLFCHIYVHALFPKIGIPHGNQATIHVFCGEFQELLNADFIFKFVVCDLIFSHQSYILALFTKQIFLK